MLATLVPEMKSPVEISHQTPVFMIGSCFSVVFGKLLEEKKIPVHYNPFGTVYNPISIHKMIGNILDKKVPVPKKILEWNHIFYHDDYHSDMSALTRDGVIQNIKKATDNAHLFLKTSKVLFITLGTSIVYQKIDTENIVANCHKIPGSQFRKKMLPIEEMVSSLSETIDLLNIQFPEIYIVFTISPVRHIRDGLIENNRSKARLIEVVHTLVEKFKNVGYFPSYELVVDQLRDYRYYEKDLIHPNELAHEVLWEYFTKTYFSLETNKIIQRIEKLTKAYRHKPQFMRHPEYLKFCKKQLEEIDFFEKSGLDMYFTNEKSHFIRAADDLTSQKH